MPKIKTRRSATERFSFTGTGKVKRTSANSRHRLVSKTKRQKVNKNAPTYADKTNMLAVKRMLPHKH